MLIKTEDQHVAASLIAHIEEINHKPAGVWGLLAVQRSNLENMTNDKFIIFIKPALENSTSSKVFFAGHAEIYILWAGVQKAVLQQLTDIITKSLLRADIAVPAVDMIQYYNPKLQGNEIIAMLRSKPESKAKPMEDTPKAATEVFPKLSDIEMQKFRQQQQSQLQRSMFKVLIVEDQLFSRQLLYEVLRGAYMVEASPNLKDAWKLFLEHAPDIVFLDIELADGNGHTLAQQIKTLAPSTYVVMVTANHGLNDVQQAKQNHVDGFIAKPFSNQKIQTCLDKYLSVRPAMLAKANQS